jgi:hypothetical protein
MEGKVVHKFSSIIFLGLCVVLCGCKSWSDVEIINPWIKL